MKKFWKALGISWVYFAVFMGIQFLVSMAGSLILLGSLVHEQGAALFDNVELFHEALMSGLLEHMTAMVLFSNVLTILGFWLFFKCRHRRFLREIGLYKTTVRNLTLSSLFGVGMCFFVDLLTTVLPIPESAMQQFEAQHGMLWFGDAGLTFLSVALIGPISEEICFRGLCYTRLKTGMHPWAAGFFSSVFFGIAHGNPVWFLVGFMAGISLCWIFETTGSLLCAMVVHVTNNAISSFTAYVSMPEMFHRVLIISSILLILFSGYLLYRGNCQQKE